MIKVASVSNMRLMWKLHSPRIECMVKGIVQEISHVRHVQISKPSQSSTEVSWVMMCSEYAPKACIEEGLGVISKKNKDCNWDEFSHSEISLFITYLPPYPVGITHRINLSCPTLHKFLCYVTWNNIPINSVPQNQ